MMMNLKNKVIATFLGAALGASGCGDSGEVIARAPVVQDPCVRGAQDAPDTSAVQCTTGVTLNGKPSAQTEWVHEVNGTMRSNDGNFKLTARWGDGEFRAFKQVQLSVQNGVITYDLPDATSMNVSLGEQEDVLVLEQTAPFHDSENAYCPGIKTFAMEVLSRGVTLGDTSCDYDSKQPNVENGCFPCAELNQKIRQRSASSDPEAMGRLAVLSSQALTINAMSDSPYKAEVGVLLGSVLISSLFAWLGKGKSKTSYDEDENMWGIETAFS